MPPVAQTPSTTKREPGLLQDLAVLGDGGAGAGGRVDVSADDDVVVPVFQPAVELARRHGPAPLALEDVVIEAEGPADLGHAVAEIALRQDENAVAPAGHVEDGHLHGERPGAGDDERLAGVAEHDLLEVLAGLLEVVDHLGTDMRNRGQGQGVEDARNDGARAGDQEQFLFGHRVLRGEIASIVTKPRREIKTGRPGTPSGGPRSRCRIRVRRSWGCRVRSRSHGGTAGTRPGRRFRAGGQRDIRIPHR